MNQKPRAIIVGLIDQNQDLQKQKASLKEAGLLVDTYGGEVVKVITQNASHQSSSTYIGRGKAEDLSRQVMKNEIDFIVINDHLKSGQIFTLGQLISPSGECDVWDRTQLILQIFKNHANTAEAKLQIKLADLHHKGPELSGLGVSMSQQAGGIGTRGIGETNTEIMRRHWRKEIRQVEKKLEKLTQNRQQQMKHRKQSGVPTASIIGYTNAGKTTLFNAISNKEDKVQDELFATLDSSVSSLYLHNVGKKIYISDTIGFIQDLPTILIDAFKSTLMETINADILLHVIDSLDVDMFLKINTVNQLLKSLDLESKPQIYVFNKIDKISIKQKENLSKIFDHQKHVFISAREDLGVDELVSIIEIKLMDMGLKRADHLSYLDDLEESN